VKEDSRRRLKEFVERATYLESLSYLDNRESIAGVNVTLDPDGSRRIDFFQPTDEQRDALLLTLRLFVQDKDGISLRRMADLHGDPGISEAWKTEHSRMRTWLNGRLDEAAAERDGVVVLRHRDVLNAVLYGKLAHYQPDDPDARRYREWTKDEMATKLLHSQFHKVVVWVIAAIINVSRASQEELARDAG
jgi:hypothetical protein